MNNKIEDYIGMQQLQSLQIKPKQLETSFKKNTSQSLDNLQIEIKDNISKLNLLLNIYNKQLNCIFNTELLGNFLIEYLSLIEEKSFQKIVLKIGEIVIKPNMFLEIQKPTVYKNGYEIMVIANEEIINKLNYNKNAKNLSNIIKYFYDNNYIILNNTTKTIVYDWKNKRIISELIMNFPYLNKVILELIYLREHDFSEEDAYKYVIENIKVKLDKVKLLNK